MLFLLFFIFLNLIWIQSLTFHFLDGLLLNLLLSQNLISFSIFFDFHVHIFLEFRVLFFISFVIVRIIRQEEIRFFYEYFWHFSSCFLFQVQFNSALETSALFHIFEIQLLFEVLDQSVSTDEEGRWINHEELEDEGEAHHFRILVNKYTFCVRQGRK